MELAVKQHREEKHKFQINMEHVLQENDRLLTQELSVEIVNVVVHDKVMSDCLNRDTVSSSKSAPTFAELFETNELKALIQEKDTVILKLKEKIKFSSVDVKERKVERKVEEIETQNLELDHKVTKLITENEHLKQTYKQLFDSIKSSRVQSKEHCDDLINKVNLKSVEVSDLNASLQEKVLVITALKEQLSKLKGKVVLTDAVSLNPIDSALLQVDVVPKGHSDFKLKEKLNSFSGDVNEIKVKREVGEIETLNLELDHKVTKLAAENEHLKQTYKQLFDSIKSSRVQSKEHCDDLINKVNLKSVEVSDLNASLQEKVLVITALKAQLQLFPKLHKNRTAHTDYIRHTQEEAVTLREIVECERLLSPLNTSLAYACKYTRRIQELLMILQQTCHSVTDLGIKLVALTPKNKTKQIRRTAQITKSEIITVATSPSPNIDSNTPVLSSIGVTLVSSASGSKSQDNTKKNRMRRAQKKAKKTELEDHLRTVKSKYINSVNASKKSKSVKTPVKRKVWKSTGKVFKTIGYIWNPRGRTFTLVGNVCPLTRIATATIVPHREPIPIVKSMDKPVVTLVYTRKPKAKKVRNKMKPNKSWGSNSNVSSSLTDC
nr:hypothetical protein [Tanacetum cinerariifolium]